MARPKSIFPDVFWKHTNKKTQDECWEWTHSKDVDGYGIFHFVCDNPPTGLPTRAHRVSLFLHKGAAPTDKPFAIHSCDNPSCVNPNHLSWNTNKQNQIEARDRGLLDNLTPKRAAYFKAMSDADFDLWKQRFVGKEGKAIGNLTRAIKWREND